MILCYVASKSIKSKLPEHLLVGVIGVDQEMWAHAVSPCFGIEWLGGYVEQASLNAHHPI